MVAVGSIIASREREETAKNLARTEAKEAQTRLLQSQLHPHVLFNSLNGLLELVHKDPHAAESCIRNMSDLLHTLLKASEQSYFRLEQERELVGYYLGMEGIRLGSRLEVAWDWPSGLDRLLVPPLLLQPLVENAIKHGIAPNIVGGTVRIRALASDGFLTLEVGNTGCEPLAGHRIGAVGLRNLKERIQLAFGAHGHFSLTREGDWTKAVIRLPIMAELVI